MHCGGMPPPPNQQVELPLTLSNPHRGSPVVGLLRSCVGNGCAPPVLNPEASSRSLFNVRQPASPARASPRVPRWGEQCCPGGAHHDRRGVPLAQAGSPPFQTPRSASTAHLSPPVFSLALFAAFCAFPPSESVRLRFPRPAQRTHGDGGRSHNTRAHERRRDFGSCVTVGGGGGQQRCVLRGGRPAEWACSRGTALWKGCVQTAPEPPRRDSGYCTCAHEAVSTKRRKKFGSSVAYKGGEAFTSAGGGGGNRALRPDPPPKRAQLTGPPHAYRD